jgi:small subunit ribosomal protein S5
MANRYKKPENQEFQEKVVQISRVSKKTKGGNQSSFSVLVVVGDKKGRVGVALGKAPDVISSIKKAVRKAKKHLITVPMKRKTIPFAIDSKHGAAKIILKPAPAGSGIIAGGAVRAVVEAAGIQDIIGKSLGSSNQANNVHATFKALQEVERLVNLKNIQLKQEAVPTV